MNPPQRILVVDDEPCLRELSSRVLIQYGYQVDAAEDGAKAWDTLQFKKYDLLITDHNMPNLTGVDLLRRLRAAHMALPVILVSGAIPTEELSRYPGLQLAALLQKPFTSDKLVATVRTVFDAIDSIAEQHEPMPIRRTDPSVRTLRL